MIELVEGDITQFAADAIVNAANSKLVGGGGVDGAIHRVGGPAIMAELDAIRARSGYCPAGQAVVTAAGDLPARWVIHAVGPVYRGGDHGERELLTSCYEVSLRLASEKGATSIAFPAISAGVYGYPLAEAAEVAVGAVAARLAEHAVIERVAFVLFDRKTYSAFQRALQALQSNG